jgi:hypothetical protein
MHRDLLEESWLAGVCKESTDKAERFDLLSIKVMSASKNALPKLRG